jgi:hypothetical protein
MLVSTKPLVSGCWRYRRTSGMVIPSMRTGDYRPFLQFVMNKRKSALHIFLRNMCECRTSQSRPSPNVKLVCCPWVFQTVPRLVAIWVIDSRLLRAKLTCWLSWIDLDMDESSGNLTTWWSIDGLNTADAANGIGWCKAFEAHQFRSDELFSFGVEIGTISQKFPLWIWMKSDMVRLIFETMSSGRTNWSVSFVQANLNNDSSLWNVHVRFCWWSDYHIALLSLFVKWTLDFRMDNVSICNNNVKIDGQMASQNFITINLFIECW